jgi:hypothetical protein
MKKIAIAAVLALLTLPAWAQEEHGRPELATTEPPMLGLHWARGAQPDARTNNAGPKGAGRSPNLTYHNGPILTTTVVKAIFWGRKWESTSADAAFIGDKITGTDLFYDGVSGTDYAKTNTEYTSATSQVTAGITYQGHVVDPSQGPTTAPSTSAVLAEVCKMIGAPVSNGYYPVYTDLARGNAGYCAWHSWGTCSNVNVQFGFFFALDGDGGCDPQDGVSRDNKPSQALAALANVGAHELSEAMTDPRGSGWYDQQGYENSDKCAWDFGTSFLTFSNGRTWKIQGNWSNRAYNAGYAYANEKGQKGCLDGGDYKLLP